METRKTLLILVLALAFVRWAPAPEVTPDPVRTAFTYQGLLYDANDVADGQYDFQFKLFDSFAGSKVDGDVNVPDVDVFDGYFTVELDFNDVYDGNERWLEIGVRPGEMNDPNVYTVLEPRQELTATPYALYALSGGGAGGGIGGSGTTDYIAKFTDPNTIGDSVISELASEVVISGRSLLLDNSQSYMSAASGGAATALLFMDGSDNVQIGDWAGGGDLYLRANGDRVIVKGSTGNVGIGTPSPEFKLTLDNDGGIIAKGTYNSGVDLTVSGAGTRLIWYPKKAAFRAGRVSGGQWDDPNIGIWSVAMGEDNTASGNWATVGGGLLNTGSGGTATVGGGYSNTASGGHTTIGGGFENTASASTATVGGGFENTARGVHATVGGGYYNDANGIGATVPGGYDNAASGVVSFAAGNRAKANHHGSFVWADSTDADFNSTNPNQFLIRASGGVGIGTPSPDRQLTVYNSGSAFQNVKDGTRELLMGVDSSGGIISAYTNHDLVFRAGGNSEKMRIKASGEVGVGTTNPAYDLDVNGSIRAIGGVYYGGSEGSANGTEYAKPDYVFEEGYDVMSIEQVEQYLKKENHLPWMTSARDEKEENGGAIDITRMAFETVETAENLQMQVIELNKRMKLLEAENKDMKSRLASIESMLAKSAQ